MMLVDLAKALGIIREALTLDPDTVTTSDASKVFDAFVELERAGLAGKTLYARRAAAAGDWRKEGYRNPESWVAQTTGSGLGDARGLLDTAERLDALPETTEALRRGALSASQLKEIAATAIENPLAERKLIETAGRSGSEGAQG